MKSLNVKSLSLLLATLAIPASVTLAQTDPDADPDSNADADAINRAGSVHSAIWQYRRHGWPKHQLGMVYRYGQKSGRLVFPVWNRWRRRRSPNLYLYCATRTQRGPGSWNTSAWNASAWNAGWWRRSRWRWWWSRSKPDGKVTPRRSSDESDQYPIGA